jgi:hypothetical protein
MTKLFPLILHTDNFIIEHDSFLGYSAVQSHWSRLTFQGSKHLWNMSLVQWDYMALYHRKMSSSSLLLWEPEISQFHHCSIYKPYFLVLAPPQTQAIHLDIHVSAFRYIHKQNLKWFLHCHEMFISKWTVETDFAYVGTETAI